MLPQLLHRDLVWSDVGDQAFAASGRVDGRDHGAGDGLVAQQRGCGGHLLPQGRPLISAVKAAVILDRRLSSSAFGDSGDITDGPPAASSARVTGCSWRTWRR